LRSLIVNADDLGLTEGVNLGILDAHFEGIVTSATLLANGSAFNSAVAMLASAPGLGVGIHLNLTEGAPVSDPSHVPTLLDARNRLHFSPLKLWTAIAAGQVRVAEIETELRAQITKIVRAGIAPTHLDGHKHIHVVPAISAVVIRLAVEFGIPAVRCPLEKNPPMTAIVQNHRSARISVAKQYLVGRAVSVLAHRLKKELRVARLASASHFHGLSQTGFLTSPALEEMLDQLPMGTNELMCHPGFTDASLESTGTRLLAQREAELLALKTAKETVAARGIRLATYSQVVAPTAQSRSAA
jgi:chitin disaccharide deacetylase